jgi:hypothetical protein
MPKARRDPFFITNAVLNPLLLTLLKSKAGLILGRRLAVVEYTGRRVESRTSWWRSTNWKARPCA